MPPSVVAAGKSRNYATQLLELLRVSVVQLGRAPTHVRRRGAARRLGRNVLLLTTVGGAFVIALMISLDATEIALMPPRGSPDLWPARILTDFGKNAFVLYALIAALAAIALAAPLLQRA